MLHVLDTKLKVGSIILVHGWVMLEGLEDGARYRVVAMPERYGKPTYVFVKVRGRKRIRHYAHSVDLWIDSPVSSDLNRIEVEDTAND